MNKLFAIAGLAAVSAASDDLRQKLQHAIDAEFGLLTAVLEKLDAVDETLADHSSKLDILDEEQVMKHHHYINEEEIKLPELGLLDKICFAPFTVRAEHTLDFSARLSTPGALN